MGNGDPVYKLSTSEDWSIVGKLQHCVGEGGLKVISALKMNRIKAMDKVHNLAAEFQKFPGGQG